MTVTLRHRRGTVTGHLDAWDERGAVVDGVRYPGPVLIISAGVAAGVRACGSSTGAAAPERRSA